MVERVVTRDPTKGLTPPARQEIRNPGVKHDRTHIRNLFWCLPFLLAGLCFWKGLPSAHHAPESTATAAIKPAVAERIPARKRTLVTRPIQDIVCGQRVIASNPQLTGQDVPQLEIDPETTRLVSLHMLKPDGHELKIDTLVSLDVLLALTIDDSEVEPESASPTLAPPIAFLSPLPLSEAAEDFALNELLIGLNDLLIGHVVEMNLPELGADGPATITSIRPSPPIEPDDGTGRRLVTSVFRHSAASVIDLQAGGSDDSIGVTANHPFWSEDRQEFVPAGDLRPGENLRKADGTFVQVTRMTPRGGSPVPVFNFEVDGQHVYSAGADGLLVHNACHLNSHSSGAASYGYVIWNTVTGQILKFGISSRPLTKALTSPRITSQISKLLRKKGIIAEGKIIDWFPDRASVVAWEKAAIEAAKKYGWTLPQNLRP